MDVDLIVIYIRLNPTVHKIEYNVGTCKKGGKSLIIAFSLRNTPWDNSSKTRLL